MFYPTNTVLPRNCFFLNTLFTTEYVQMHAINAAAIITSNFSQVVASFRSIAVITRGGIISTVNSDIDANIMLWSV